MADVGFFAEHSLQSTLLRRLGPERFGSVRERVKKRGGEYENK